MKKRFLLILLLCLGWSTLMAQESIVWDFPIKPSSDGWKKLYDQDMKVQACKIPIEILPNISTQNLVDLCLNYPLLINITAFSSFQFGMDDFKKNFNGIVELYRRNEGPKLLIEKYTNLSPKNFDPNWSSFQKGQYAFNFVALELLLSQKELLDNLSNDELKRLLVNSLKKFDDKTGLMQIYDDIGLRSLGYLITSIILKVDPNGIIIPSQDFKELNAISNSSSMYSNEQLLKIVNLANVIIPKL